MKFIEIHPYINILIYGGFYYLDDPLHVLSREPQKDCAARKTQRETLRTARKNAWEQFKKDAKACKTDNPETGVEASIDAQN